MEINKQLFEDVLSGKLKGKFVLKNGSKVNSNKLCKKENRSIYCYWLKGFSPLYTVNGIPNSIFARKYTIIDFIPKPNYKTIDLEMLEYCRRDFEFMQTLSKEINNMNTLEIKIPDGMCIDESKSTFEKIVFKKKDTKPRSWKEYLEQYKNVPCYELGFDVSGGYWGKSTMYGNGYCAVPSKELAEAFLAMMQLVSLRQAWIGNWEPDWNDSNKKKWCIIKDINRLVIGLFSSCSRPLSFPTKEMAEDFMNCFKDLLEVSKPLI